MAEERAERTANPTPIGLMGLACGCAALASAELDTRRNPSVGSGSGALSVDLPPDRSDLASCRLVSGDFGRSHPMAARRSWKIRRSML